MFMDNIYALQESMTAFFKKDLENWVTFDTWKDTLCSTRDPLSGNSAVKIFDRYGDKLTPQTVDAEVQLTNDPWSPSFAIGFVWNHKDVNIKATVFFVAGEVIRTQVMDMFRVNAHFGDDYDFVKAFEKSVVLLSALRS